jgi:hypothetical protein
MTASAAIPARRRDEPAPAIAIELTVDIINL